MAVKGVASVVGAQLLITAGDNPDRFRSSASFAALCGTAPIPVSSRRTDRYRLSRGGDRAANAALHHIVKVRTSCDPATRACRDTRLAHRWTNKAVWRDLKRAVAREIYEPSSATAMSPTTKTYDPPGKPRTSPSPRPHTTSPSGPCTSPPSNAAPAEIIPSPPSTATGSTLLDNQ